MIRNLVLSVVLALALFGPIATTSAQKYVPPTTICTTYGVGDTAYIICKALAHRAGSASLHAGVGKVLRVSWAPLIHVS